VSALFTASYVALWILVVLQSVALLVVVHQVATRLMLRRDGGIQGPEVGGQMPKWHGTDNDDDG